MASRSRLDHAVSQLENVVAASSDVKALRALRERMQLLTYRLDARITRLENSAFAVTVTTLSGEKALIDELQPNTYLTSLRELVEKEFDLTSGMAQLCFGGSCICDITDWSGNLGERLEDYGIGDGADLTCVSCFPWTPIGNSPNAVLEDGSSRVFQLFAQNTNGTSVVSAKPTRSVAFRVVKAGIHAQRNLGLGVGNAGHARSHFSIIAEVGNHVFAGCGMGGWDVARVGLCAKEGDVLGLRYDGEAVIFSCNGLEVCGRRQLVLQEGEELFAYASITHNKGVMSGLCYGWASISQVLRLFL